MGQCRHGSTPDPNGGRQLLDDAVQGPGIGAHLVENLDLAIDEGEDRLDAEDGAEQRPGGADAPAAPEVLEILHGEDEALRRLQPFNGGQDGVSAAPPVANGHGHVQRGTVGRPAGLRLDHPDVEVGQGLARLHRGAGGAAQIGGDGGADHRATVAPQPLEDLREHAR